MSKASAIKAPARPCEACPWRKDRDARDIPNFSMELAESLAGTCPDQRGMGPSFGASWFACHLSVEGQEIPCAGWLATVGHAHPGVRLAISMGRLSVDLLKAAEGTSPLHASYGEVLEKLRASTVDEE